jgi:hypothetical protein
MYIVTTWKFPPVNKHRPNGPPSVPKARIKVSAGWAYSAASPKGAEYLWCSLWMLR